MAVYGGWLLVVLIIVIVLIVMKVVNKKQEAAVKITLILFIFLMITAGYVTISRGIDLTSFDGIKEGVRVYIAWISSIFSNIGKVTSFVINQDWSIQTAANSTKP